jgi:hypothetical protein
MVAIRILLFLVSAGLVIGTFFSALSTFVLPRAARSRLNRLVFRSLRWIFELLLRFAHTYPRRDAIMAYYAPVGLMLLLPAWYILLALGYTGMYLAVGVGTWLDALRLSISSLLTLGFATSAKLPVNLMVFSEAIFGLVMVGLLIAYLPTMYAAFSRREEAVNLLEVRAGNPPSAIEMILRFTRIHGLDRLSEYWRGWEIWFADVEESHTSLQALVFFRSPRADHSWVTAAAAVLDAAALSQSAVAIAPDPASALCIRAGYLALRRIVDYFEIPYHTDPHFPDVPISISQAEFLKALDRLAAGGVPLKPDREQAWKDFAGWRVNYDQPLLALCSLTMPPLAPWSSDRAPSLHWQYPAPIVSHKKDSV